MNPSTLQNLGLVVREADGRMEAELEVSSITLINPLSRRSINKVVFTVVGDRLIVLDPPELLGTDPVRLARVEKISDLEEQIANAFNESIFHVQRRSADLQLLGLTPQVDPETLRLTVEVAAQGFSFLLASDKRGNFRVAQAQRGDQAVDLPEMQPFELSEFRELPALIGYLVALVGGGSAEPAAAAKSPLAEAPLPPLTLDQVLARFSGGAMVPPTSSLELLVELRVAGAVYRFAAARVMGHTFRGMLAGAQGKVWAERFELQEFPGVVQLVASLFKVPLEQVEVVGLARGA